MSGLQCRNYYVRVTMSIKPSATVGGLDAFLYNLHFMTEAANLAPASLFYFLFLIQHT